MLNETPKKLNESIIQEENKESFDIKELAYNLFMMKREKKILNSLHHTQYVRHLPSLV